jgi:hypothetical protein
VKSIVPLGCNLPKKLEFLELTFPPENPDWQPDAVIPTLIRKREIMPNPTLKILPALMVAITAAWVTQPVFGGLITTNEIVITENSSTSLIVTYNGSTSGVTVNFLGHTPVGDGWKVTFPSTLSFTSVDNTGVIALWVEPEDSSQVNAGFFHPSSNVAFFFSDDSVDTNPTAVPNGTTVTDIGADTATEGLFQRPLMTTVMLPERPMQGLRLVCFFSP